ncbi:MAG: AEC family transporter [Armatimonadota bacterium]
MVVTSIIPIMLTVGVGFVLELRRQLDARVIATLSLYVLLPCLIFNSLFTTTLTLGEALPIVYVLLLTTAVLWGLGTAVSRASRMDQQEESCFLLTTMFMNAGNMGMPVALYAFGERALDLAVIAVVAMNAVMNTVAVYYSSRHRGGHREALRTVFSLPTIYAAVIALVLRTIVRPTLPGFLLDPIRMLGLATIPISQLLLGIQLAKARAQVGDHLSSAIAPNAIRLVLAPCVAFAFVSLFGVHGMTAKVAILMCAMPSAVNVAIYTTEFGLQPRRIATAVFTSTLASFVTISGVLVLLAGWRG